MLSLLRLRYLIPATAVGGYYSAKRKIEDIKSSMPELPDLHVAENLSKVENLFKASASSLQEFIAKSNAERLEAKKKFVEKEVASASQPNLHQVAQRNEPAQKNQRDEELITQRRKIDRLEKENRELRSALRSSGDGRSTSSSRMKRKIKKSLIELYSEVLDELSGYDSTYRVQDHLPKVVVVGDQSSGKTSVLEMIAGARIFPRGAGEMMTRSPVQVTLSEGPYHVARFNDSSYDFDLTKENDLAKLRKEIEERMRQSVQGGKTVSDQVISLTIQGPGLHRMVLVDLPGIISTVTSELAPDTKECIRKMVTEYMGNPNAIILCIQDGSIDAERSIFTDMVRENDDVGKRTILVLTKVDIAEKTHANPSKIKKILDGELFPMKALGYYAVVSGKSGKNRDIQEIRDYEEKFFLTSSLLERGILNSSQCSTRNLSAKVSECFWSMVKSSIEQQADACKATLFNLEAEWQRLFPHVRQLTQDEVFYNIRNEQLDEVAQLSRLSTKDWEQLISAQLWARVYDHVMEKLYFPAEHDKFHFNAKVDMELQRWIESTDLPRLALQVARDSVRLQFNELLDKKQNSPDDRIIYKDLQRAVVDEALNRYEWKTQALDVLKIVQLEAVAKQISLTKENWSAAIDLLEASLKKYIESSSQEMMSLTGPSLVERWFKWKSSTPEQQVNQVIRNEFEKLLSTHESALNGGKLSEPDVITIKRNLEALGLDVDNGMIERIWTPFHRHKFLRNEVDRARDCHKMFHFYENDIPCDTDCSHVLFFYRIQRMLEFSAKSLRRQILEGELRRINKEIQEVWDEYGDDEVKKSKLISGKRVELAEQLVKVRQIQEKLDEFITALNQEESMNSYNK